MPLNIQDQGDAKDPQPEKPSVPPPVPPYMPPASASPPPQKPAQKPPTLLDDETTGSGKKMLFWIFGIVVLASAVFLLFQFGILPPGGRKGPSDVANGPVRVDTAAARPQTAVPTVPSGKADDARAAELRQRLARTGGDFTIYISAYATAADAEELAGRWERAGYQAAVVHAGGWFRVGLGRFGSAAEARAEAEKLRQALEDGYWVGSATPGA